MKYYTATNFVPEHPPLHQYPQSTRVASIYVFRGDEKPIRVGRTVKLPCRLYQHWKTLKFTPEGVITPWGKFATLTAEAFVDVPEADLVEFEFGLSRLLGLPCGYPRKWRTESA